MSFIALFFGVPITIIALAIGFFIYRVGSKIFVQKLFLSSKLKEILYLVIYGLPLNAIGALYFGGCLKFAYSFIENDGFLQTSTITKSELFERVFLSVGMSFIAGTLNVISPIYIRIDPVINSLYETICMFFILLIINIYFSNRIFMKHYFKISHNKSNIMFMQVLNRAKRISTARIGRVYSDIKNATLYYKGIVFKKIDNENSDANYIDAKHGKRYFISHCAKDGRDPLYDTPIEIDEDVRKQYWMIIREMPENINLSKLYEKAITINS